MLDGCHSLSCVIISRPCQTFEAMTKETLYRVKFVSQDKVYELYVREVYQGDMYGFVILEDFVFGEHSGLVVDPGEEKLKSEFEGVKQTIIPMHSVIRIDEVERRGTAKIVDLDSKVTEMRTCCGPKCNGKCHAKGWSCTAMETGSLIWL